MAIHVLGDNLHDTSLALPGNPSDPDQWPGVGSAQACRLVPALPGRSHPLTSVSWCVGLVSWSVGLVSCTVGLVMHRPVRSSPAPPVSSTASVSLVQIGQQNTRRALYLTDAMFANAAGRRRWPEKLQRFSHLLAGVAPGVTANGSEVTMDEAMLPRGHPACMTPHSFKKL